MVLEGGQGTRKGSACFLELHCFTAAGSCLANGHRRRPASSTPALISISASFAAATACGIGFADIKRFLALMCTPPLSPMNETYWYFMKEKLHAGTKRAADKHLQEAADQVCATYADMNIAVPDKNDV